MNNIKDKYKQFSAENHATGSGTASSYIAAINMIARALQMHKKDFLNSNENIWEIQDIQRLADLYTLVKAEQKKENGGIFKNENSKSYWQKGYCSAAIKDFSKFISLYKRENEMLDKFENADNPTALSIELENTKIDSNKLFLDDDLFLNSKEGKNVLREIKVRQNQNVFRRMVLLNYESRCCLTNLPIPEILRASHISPWAKDKINRLNPTNGICLSATYDAAFDKYLISFDDDYRLIISKSLKEFYSNQAVNDYFKKLEGNKIMMPRKFYPSKELLQLHRKNMI